MNNSELLFERAQLFIPGGVNSPVRAFRSVGGTPLFFKSAKVLFLLMSMVKITLITSGLGAYDFRHCHKPIVETLKKATENTTSLGTNRIRSRHSRVNLRNGTCSRKGRMTNSGTEACMSAIRVARGYTNKEKFIKFEGNYHGHADAFLIKAGSGAITLGVPNSPGVTKGTAQDTLLAPYNDLSAVKKIIEDNPNQIAAIILEPVAGNMGCIPPKKGFLEGLRSLCNEHDIVLIFDEVMTGFRLSKGGASEYYGVTPDMVTLGKIIGGGLPVGAFGGKKEIMDMVAPVGPVYQAGTLSGNPIAMGCGYTLLKELNENPSIYSQLEKNTAYFEKELIRVFDNKNLRYTINRVGSMISFHFDVDEVNNFDDACNANADLFKTLFHGVLKRGVYFAPSAFESLFLSTTQNKELLDNTIEAIEETLEEIL